MRVAGFPATDDPHPIEDPIRFGTLSMLGALRECVDVRMHAVSNPYISE
jgi:hypothetical protein